MKVDIYTYAHITGSKRPQGMLNMSDITKGKSPTKSTFFTMSI